MVRKSGRVTQRPKTRRAGAHSKPRRAPAGKGGVAMRRTMDLAFGGARQRKAKAPRDEAE
jgi:hypothetical protein